MISALFPALVFGLSLADTLPARPVPLPTPLPTAYIAAQSPASTPVTVAVPETVLVRMVASPPKGLSIQEWGVLVAILSGIGGLIKIAYEMNSSTRQKRLDLRWKKASLAREIIQEVLASRECRDALMMMDWEGKTYAKGEGRTEPIDYDRIAASLVPDVALDPDDDAVWLRDTFDVLFDRLRGIEIALRSSLVEFDDIRPFFDYYISKVHRSPVLRDAMLLYLEQYGYDAVIALLKRFAPPTDI